MESRPGHGKSSACAGKAVHARGLVVSAVGAEWREQGGLERERVRATGAGGAGGGRQCGQSSSRPGGCGPGNWGASPFCIARRSRSGGWKLRTKRVPTRRSCQPASAIQSSSRPALPFAAPQFLPPVPSPSLPAAEKALPSPNPNPNSIHSSQPRPPRAAQPTAQPSPAQAHRCARRDASLIGACVEGEEARSSQWTAARA